jgi:hypothetical protein
MRFEWHGLAVSVDRRIEWVSLYSDHRFLIILTIHPRQRRVECSSIILQVEKSIVQDDWVFLVI